MNELTSKMANMNVVNQGWNQMWGGGSGPGMHDSVNLMTEKEIRTRWLAEEANKRAAREAQQLAQGGGVRNRGRGGEDSASSDVMRCTLKKVPDCASLLQKSRLPLGLILHPFKEDPNIPLITESTIVRCRACRTYINPYVRLLDSKRWQCNLCSRVNEVPDEFIYDFQRQRHLDIHTRPELNYDSIEYVASVEYMVRPPQPATYLFVLEATASAVASGYIPRFARAMAESLADIPGDARSMLGFLAFDRKLHFFNLNEDRPVHYVMPDIEDTFIPHTDAVLVNIKSRRKAIQHFLTQVLPTFPFDPTNATGDAGVADQEAALGAALQVAFKIISPSGGRITLVQTSLPAAGPKGDGSVLSNREDPNARTANSAASTAALTPLLNPATDFYKKLALECSEQQVTVDLFCLAADRYADLATVGTVAKFSGGSIAYYGGGGGPSSPAAVGSMLARFEADMRHYLTRAIGFEAVMRLRCTRGISIHTFHGNFFVRSTDLIALPNVCPDASYAIQMTISEDLKEFSQVALQAALLYTASNGERRIRVHTIALPVVTVIGEVLAGADQEAIACLLAKMAVDRSMQSNVQEAREAMIFSNVDIINTYRLVNGGGGGGGGGGNNPSGYNSGGGLVTGQNTKLLPLYTLALMKHTAFRLGISTRVDERVFAMMQMKSLPIRALLLYIYPNLYPLHHSLQQQSPDQPLSPLPVQLTFANIDRNGIYLLDTYDHLYLYICKSVSPQFLVDVFAVTQWSQIPDEGEQNSTTVGGGVPPHLPSSGTFAVAGGYGQQQQFPPRSNHLPQPPPPVMNGHYQRPQEQQYSTEQEESLNTTEGGDQTVTSTSNGGEEDVDEEEYEEEVEGEEVSEEVDLNASSESDGSPVKRKVVVKKKKGTGGVKRQPTVTLPLLDNPTSRRIHAFIGSLIEERPFKPNFHILREDSRLRYAFLQYMYDDRNESAFSYYEFLQHIQQTLDK